MSSVARVTEALDRAEEAQRSLNAFTMLFREQALAAAQRCDQEPARGPLDGAPVLVKDLFDIQGVVTSGCSRAYADNIAAKDAPAVDSLRRAGAVIIGKTNMHELAFGATGDVSSIGPANNPWDLARMTGGSSSGSAAAVAAGIVDVALGTDTGGSVRIPASLCGVSSLKTTHGLIPLDGVLPLSVSLDTVGPIARDASFLALAMQALTGIVPEEPRGDITIGLPAGWMAENIHPEVEAAVAEAARVFERAGAKVIDVEIPNCDRTMLAWVQLAMPEFLKAHGNRDMSLMDPSIATLIEGARAMQRSDYEAGLAAQAAAREDFAKLFTQVDALLSACTPVTAPPHFKAEAYGAPLSVKTRLANVPGIPAIAMPCGLDSNNLPIGFQMAGPRNSEGFLLGLGTAYQRMTGHHLNRPR